MSTGKRKCISDNDDDDDRKPPAKVLARDDDGEKNKQCSQGYKEADTTPHILGGIDVFSIDLIGTTIFSYLDTKELFTMSKTSCLLRGLIQHKHVVRSSLLRGGHAKQSIERIVKLIRERKIWTPSAVRLLRLCNGKRCERCNVEKANLVSGDYGVFFCWHGCIKQQFSQRVGWNKKWSPFLNHPRVAAATYSSNAYIFTRPYIEKSCGQPAGPLVTQVDMEQVLRDSRRRGDVTDLIDKLLAERDHQDINAKYAKEIIETFHKSEQDAIVRLKEKQGKRNEATNNAIEKKKEKVLILVEKLSKVLGDAPWKDYVLDYRHVTASKSTQPSIQFKNQLADLMLADLIKSPSKATKAKMEEVKSKLAKTFDYFWKNNYHDFGFLSDTDEYERAIKVQYTRKFPNHEHLNHLPPYQLQQLQEGGDLLECKAWPFGPHLESILLTALKETMIQTLTETLPKEDERLVYFYWRRIERKQFNLRIAFETCRKELPAVYKSAINFLKSPEAKAWEASCNHNINSRSTCDQLMEQLHLRYEAFSHLLENDFSSLIKWFEEEPPRTTDWLFL